MTTDPVRTSGIAWLVLAATISTVACSGDDTPSSATPTTSAVSVVLASDVIRVGETTQATASATTSAGSQPVTTGFLSDTTAVASVSTSGLVTGIAPGRANIHVTSGGRLGAQLLRVNPDFQGQWQGLYTITSCTHTGVFATVDFCGEVTGSAPTRLTMTQSRDTLSGTFLFGTIAFPAFTAPIEADGTASFTSTSPGDIPIIATWRVGVGGAGNTLVGSVSQIWRTVGASGEGRISGTLTSVVRVSSTGSTTMTPMTARPRSVRDGLSMLQQIR